MKELFLSPQKQCIKCGLYKPLDAEHWRRNKNYGSGFDAYCKSCASKSIKAHYRKFTHKDKARRGKVGVKCILWSPRCGVCPCISESNLSACWRLAQIDPTSKHYPQGLRSETP